MVFIGKVESINKGPHFLNTSIILENKEHVNIKLDFGQEALIQVGIVYAFTTDISLKDEQTIYKAVDIKPLGEVIKDEKKLEKYLTAFYVYAPMTLTEIKKGIEGYLKQIDNKILLKVTKYLYQKYEANYYIHPAATKFHHAYVGGLAYHTLTMLKIIESFLNIYPYLNKNLLYAATILHDIAKIDEITSVDGEYTPQGLLLGHLVIGATEIQTAAVSLGIENSEEVMLLKHLMISHHGQLQFGSPKKPQTGEALLLWYVDTIDSKFTELGSALSNIKPGEFTNNINVLDKMRFYKPKL